MPSARVADARAGSADLRDDRVSDAAKVFKFGDEYRACKLQKCVFLLC